MHRATRFVALSLTVFTGFSGLVYEVAWEKYLATLLGAHSEATAALLGLFLGGLAIGYSLFGRLARRIVDHADAAEGLRLRLLWVYGFVEIGIGVFALAFPQLFEAALWVSSRLPHAFEFVAFGFDVLLCAVLILPAAVLMGGTIPVLTQALSRDTLESTRIHAFVYGFNTLGAFAGAVAAGFWFIPSFGLVTTIYSVAAVNLLAGTLFVVMGRRGVALRGSQREEAANPAIPGLRRYLFSALLLGFAMMTVQVVVIRIGALSFGSSQFTFSMVVAVFVLCIGIGSLGVSALRTIPTPVIVGAPFAVALLLCAMDPMLERAPYGAYVLRTMFSSNPASLVPYQLSAFGGVLALIGAPVMLSGAALPLLFHRLRNHAIDLGANAGRLYGWNTFGSLIGALLSGYWLLFWLDLDQVYRLAIVALSIASTLLIVTTYPRRRTLAVAPLVITSLLLVALPDWRPRYLMSGLFRTREARPQTWSGAAAVIGSLRYPPYVFHTDGPIASIGVGEIRRGETLVARSIVTNGKSDGNTFADYPTMGLLGSLPSLLAERVERAFVVGFGTGVTAGEIASLDHIEEVVVAEISPGVVDAIEYFDFANMNVSSNPKIQIERRDAYRALMASEGSFDVIVSEPSNPWVAGVEMLFSREFLTAARDRLRPGGVHCQWFHLYETDRPTLRLVLNTYASVFDRFAIWYGRGNDLLIVGFESPEQIDIARLKSRFERADFRASFGRSGVDSFAAALAHELVPVGASAPAEPEGPIHSLLNPRLGYVASRGFFVGQTVRIPFSGYGALARAGREGSLWRRYFAGLSADEAEPAYERFARAVCANRNPECVAVLADWHRLFPNSPLAAQTLDTLEQSIYTYNGKIDRNSLTVYRNAFTRPGSNSLRIATVSQAARLYRHHHFHGAPPLPDALVNLWSRCRGSGEDAKRCAVGLANAKQMRQLDSVGRSKSPAQPGG